MEVEEGGAAPPAAAAAALGEAEETAAPEDGKGMLYQFIAQISFPSE